MQIVKDSKAVKKTATTSRVCYWYLMRLWHVDEKTNDKVKSERERKRDVKMCLNDSSPSTMMNAQKIQQEQAE